jgi:hypothetical protein
MGLVLSLNREAKLVFELLEGDSVIEECYERNDDRAKELIDTFLATISDIPDIDERDKFYYDDIPYDDKLTPE